MRMRKKKYLDERLGSCEEYLIPTDNENRDFSKADEIECLISTEEIFGNSNPLHLEIGCGKGTFVTETAKRNPDKFYIAMEVVPDVIMLAMEKAASMELDNVMFVCFNAEKLTDVFEENELCGLYLNFSDPWPKNRHHKRRLTYISFLEMYKKVINNGGNIFFKTDNRPMFDFSLVQFNEAKIPLCEVCTDLHTSMWEKDNIHTEYEDNFSAKGFTINRLVGTVVK